MQSLTLSYVLEYAEKNISSFTVEQFMKYHKDRHIPDFFTDFKSLNRKELHALTRRIVHSKERIKRLKTYRDKVLAHDDIEQINIAITKRDVTVLMTIVENTIDLLYRRLDFSTNNYTNFKETPKREFDALMQRLKVGEKQQVKELNEKYGLKIHK